MTNQGKTRRALALITGAMAFGSATASAAPAAPGAAEISGTGAIISGHGYAHTCRDGGVFLIPATGTWKSWAEEKFGKMGPGYASPAAVRQLPADQSAWNAARHADCNPAGQFKFSGVAEGKYYVVADISWLIRWQHNGNALIQAVDVTGRENRAVALVQDLRKGG